MSRFLTSYLDLKLQPFKEGLKQLKRAEVNPLWRPVEMLDCTIIRSVNFSIEKKCPKTSEESTKNLFCYSSLSFLNRVNSICRFIHFTFILKVGFRENVANFITSNKELLIKSLLLWKSKSYFKVYYHPCFVHPNNCFGALKRDE